MDIDVRSMIFLHPTPLSYQMIFVSLISNITRTTNEAGNTCPAAASVFSPLFSTSRVPQSLQFCCVKLYRPLFIFCSFLFVHFNVFASNYDFWLNPSVSSKSFSNNIFCSACFMIICNKIFWTTGIDNYTKSCKTSLKTLK